MEYCIDISEIPHAQAFHQVLARRLALPEWYGHNLDALFDCLTELETPVHLVIKNWRDDMAFSDGFRSVFEDAQAENPDFTVEFI